jgi:hypothetical protein
MHRQHLRRTIGHLKRALRKEQTLTAEEFNQRLQLSEAIIDYRRMIQAYHWYSVPEVILEITELASRFRETTQTIKTRSGCYGTSVVLSQPIWMAVGNCNWQVLFPAVARAFTRRRTTPIHRQENK